MRDEPRIEKDFRYKVKGLGLKFEGLGFAVYCIEFRGNGLCLWVYGLWFMVWGSGFRI